MPDPAAPRDYADEIAEAITRHIHGDWLRDTSHAESKAECAALIRSTLRERGTEAWAVFMDGKPALDRIYRERKSAQWMAVGKPDRTVRRVLVISSE